SVQLIALAVSSSSSQLQAPPTTPEQKLGGAPAPSWVTFPESFASTWGVAPTPVIPVGSAIAPIWMGGRDPHVTVAVVLPPPAPPVPVVCFTPPHAAVHAARSKKRPREVT